MGNCHHNKRPVAKQKFSFGRHGSCPGEFIGPSGVAVNSKGDILVADSMNNRVQQFGRGGTRFIREFGQTGREDTRLYRPVGITCDEADNVVVADSRNHCIKVFDEEGNFLQKFGGYGKGKSRLHTPIGVCMGSDNSVLVCDYGNKRVQVFSPQGKSLFSFGKGILSAPISCAYNGTYYFVSDEVDSAIYTFDHEGKAFGKAGEECLKNCQLKSPGDIAIRTNENLLVCDRGNNRVLVLLPKGSSAGDFGRSHCKIFCKFEWAEAVAFSPSDGRVVICDRRSHCIQGFH